jgi:hypothetical protein
MILDRFRLPDKVFEIDGGTETTNWPFPLPEL